MAKTVRFDTKQYEEIHFSADKKRIHRTDRNSTKREIRKVLVNV